MIELFDPKDINKSASSYNLDKLLWLNSHYIKSSSNERLYELLQDFTTFEQEKDTILSVIDLVKSRAKTLKDLANEVQKILIAPSQYDSKSIKKAFKGEAKEILKEFVNLLKEKNPKSKEEYHDLMQEFVSNKEIGFGKLGQPLRVALLGSLSGPGLDEVMAIIKLDEVEKRVNNILKYVEDNQCVE
jgi:glutamyl-tRNA synthetase